MIAFLEKTWVLWWILAVVFIVRWFHVVSADRESYALDSPNHEQGESHMISGPLGSQA
jgi:hypothetical protein